MKPLVSQLLLKVIVGEYKGMSRHIGPITMSDFLCSLVLKY